MDKPTPRQRATHVLEAIQLIKTFVKGMDEASFLTNIQVQSATQYQFLIIGEAIRHIDDDILAKYPYPWHVPRSFRNFIIHVYHGIKMERIYSASQDLDDLEKQVKAIIQSELEQSF